MDIHTATETAYKIGHAKGYADGVRDAKTEVARGIFEEIIKSVFTKIPDKIMLISKERDFSDGVILGKREAYFDMINTLAELKKKYTEEQI